MAALLTREKGKGRLHLCLPEIKEGGEFRQLGADHRGRPGQPKRVPISTLWPLEKGGKGPGYSRLRGRLSLFDQGKEKGTSRG